MCPVCSRIPDIAHLEHDQQPGITKAERRVTQGYALGYKHGTEGFPVAPVVEGEKVPSAFQRAYLE